MTDKAGNPQKPTERDRREARLAAALRDNLKRRKAAAPGNSPKTDPEPDKS